MPLQSALFGFLLAALMTSSVGSSSVPKRVQISEDSRLGTFVTNVNLLLQSSTQEQKFNLLNQKLTLGGSGDTSSVEEEDWFDIEPSTGIITLKRAVDRDILCSDAPLCVIHLQIYAISHRRLLDLDVVIDDINDNPPIFPFHRIIVNVSEDSKVGDVISLDNFLARDADIGDNSIIAYSISKNSYFELVLKDEIPDSTGLQLRIMQVLDHETKPVIQLTLTAQDHGVPPLSDSSELVIKISDVNDNDPVFEQPVYELNLPENLEANYVIMRVLAHDRDPKDSGQIRYFFSSTKNKPRVGNLLRVDPITGDVILKDTLDRETYSSLEVFVEARDSSLTNQRVGHTRILISIDDINDNAPNIDIDFIFIVGDGLTGYFPENSGIGFGIALISVKDPDLGDNGKVQIDISDITPDKKKATDFKPPFNLSKEGILKTNQNFDREVIDRYEVTIRACDFGSPKKCSSKILTLILLDENDHRPVMTPSQLTLNVPEDASPDTYLTTIHAVDKDAVNLPAYMKTKDDKIEKSSFGQILFHIIDGDGTFAIDPNTGQFSLARRLDREQKERYQVTVRAKDGGREVGLQSTCRIQILVEDINDNYPHFVEPKQDNVTFYATIVRSHVIAKVQALDYDLGDNGSVVYSITSVKKGDVSGESLFQIHSTTGELTLNFSNPKLNDSLGLYKVKVQASDKAALPRSRNRILAVMIIDLETLPTDDVINLKVTSPPAMFFIIICVASSLIVLIIIIIILVVKFRTEQKQSRTYACGMDPQEEDWALGNLVRVRSSVDSRALGLHHEEDVELIPTEKRCDSVLTRSSCNPLGGDRASNASRKSSLATHRLSQSDAHLTALKYPANTVEQKFPIFKRNVRMTSSHDCDSGRGDSDPDTHLSDVTNDGESHKQVLVTMPPSIVPKHPTRMSRCSEQCRLYGHSDACWMPHTPNIKHQQAFCRPPRFKPPPNAPSPSSINLPPSRPESRQLQFIRGSIPQRHGWNYPSNDLSAIYSDVVMSTQFKPQSSFPRMENVNTRHDYVIDDVGPQRPLDFCLPTSIPTMSNMYGYQTITGACSSLKRTPESKDTSGRRLSGSFLVSPACIQSPLARSSSLDILSGDSQHPTSSKEDPRRSRLPTYKNDPVDVGEVSMEETQEIIDNIEQLLNS